MGNLTTIQETIGEAGASLNEFISDNKSTLGIIGAGIGGIALGSAVATVVSKKSSSKSKTKRKATNRSSRKRSSRSKKRNYKYARTAGKRKDRSHKRIRMTKKGQPYIILKSGKARFIKKSSAHSSRKRKGGRY